MTRVLRGGVYATTHARGKRFALTPEEALPGLRRAVEDLHIPEGQTVSQLDLARHATGKFVFAREVTIRNVINQMTNEQRKQIRLPPKRQSNRA